MASCSDVVVSEIKPKAFLRKTRHSFENFSFVVWLVFLNEFIRWSAIRVYVPYVRNPSRASYVFYSHLGIL